MNLINLLIIEDEDYQIQAYEDAIDSHNKKNSEVNFTSTVCQNFDDGENALKTPYYDAAIIDLKLSNSDQLEGRALVEAIYQKIRIPIVVYSGSLPQITDIQENALLIKKSRTEKFSGVLEEIKNIYSTGITSFLRPLGNVDQKLTDIFWNHLAIDIKTWIEHNNQETLLRYILSHFQEHLEINVEGDFEEYHPFEVYIKPPIKKNLHTGELVNYLGSFYIVLTPACDVVTQRYDIQEDGSKKVIRKAEKLMLVKAKDFDLNLYCLDDKGEKIDKGKLKSYVNNGSYRFHYLPDFQGNNGFIIDFQDVISVEGNTEFERIATISSPFIKDIISRFSSYYSRQGQPTFNQNKIIADLLIKGNGDLAKKN